MTALPLLKREGLGALILENPFYGSRKPRGQTLSQVLHVSDLFTLGLSLMLECLVLKRWLEGEGWGPVGLTGISMGGHVSGVVRYQGRCVVSLARFPAFLSIWHTKTKKVREFGELTWSESLKSYGVV